MEFEWDEAKHAKTLRDGHRAPGSASGLCRGDQGGEGEPGSDLQARAYRVVAVHRTRDRRTVSMPGCTTASIRQSPIQREAARTLAPAGKSISFSASKTCDNIQSIHG